MRDIIRMIVVLAVLAACSGGLLAAVKSGTAEQIEYQQLKFVKGPAIKEILQGCTNDPIIDRFKLKDGEVERSFFVGVFDGKPNAVVFESFGKGFGGDVGMMVGVNIDTDKLLGMGVTTHSETPGLGSRAKDDPSFRAQFKGLSISEPFKVKTDGGQIDAVSGATITSRGVCQGVTDSSGFYERLKPQIMEQANAFAK
ncbi:MAG: RnfABCDGE type electron transport complex subunit G [Desulfobacterales bacterium]|nr:RnfABCDGE type electron transport complex subunit G [Desulfobacterales bacterium]